MKISARPLTSLPIESHVVRRLLFFDEPADHMNVGTRRMEPTLSSSAVSEYMVHVHCSSPERYFPDADRPSEEAPHAWFVLTASNGSKWTMVILWPGFSY